MGQPKWTDDDLVQMHVVGREYERGLIEKAADEVIGLAPLPRNGYKPGEVIRSVDLGGGYDDDPPIYLETLRAALVDSAGLDAIPEPVPLIGGVLHCNSLVWVVGAPGGGKSLLVLDIAGHVGTGQTWHVHPVTQGPVLYLIAEGVHGLRPRVRAWEQANRPMTGVTFLPVAVQSATDPAWSAFCELAGELGPALIVIDTQARVTVGLDENSARDMGVLVDRLERLRRASGACVIIVHHTPRNGENPRGSTALEGAADTVIRVVKEDETVKVECRKQKDEAEFTDIEFRLVPYGSSVIVSLRDSDENYQSITPAVEKAVSAWWTQHETDWVSVTTIVDTKIATKPTFYRAAKALVRSGLVESRGDGPSRRYRLTRQPTVSTVSTESQQSHETGASTEVQSLRVSPVLRSDTGETLRTPAETQTLSQDHSVKYHNLVDDLYNQES